VKNPLTVLNQAGEDSPQPLAGRRGAASRWRERPDRGRNDQKEQAMRATDGCACYAVRELVLIG
jgi:hypothetical protein